MRSKNSSQKPFSLSIRKFQNIKNYSFVLFLTLLFSVKVYAQDAISVACIDIVDGAIDTVHCTNGGDREGRSVTANTLNTTTTLSTTVGNTTGTTSIVGDSTTISGGTNSGVLTLRDGNDTGGGVPNGTSLTISGSGGGTAATVFQTTTNANTTSVNTAIGTSAVYSAGSTATVQAGPTNAVTVNSGNTGANPGISINGVVGTGSTSTTGVLITGSGQNSEVYSTDDRNAGKIPTWADVAIQSKSYGKGDATLGSAILVTDYGVQIISPQPTGTQTITNETGINNSTGVIVNNSGSNTSSGSVTNNNGMNSGSGSVVNNTGGLSGSGSATNNIGNASSGSTGNVTNTFGQNDGAGLMNNNFGGGSGSSTNNIGVGSGVSNTTIGSTTIGSSVKSQAGGSSSTMSNGVATTSVNPSAGVGDSLLLGATQQTSGNSGTVLKGATGTHTTVDINGKLGTTSASAVASQTSASMTITNGLGNTHGFFVNEQQATISGGTRSSSLTLDDRGATFSRNSDGAPVQVHGVADGSNDFDAANIRQLHRAVAASMATIPQISLKPGETGLGVGTGFYGNHSAIGVHLAHQSSDGAQFNIGVATSGANSQTAVRAGVGWKW